MSGPWIGSAIISFHGVSEWLRPRYNQEITDKILGGVEFALANFTYHYNGFLYKIPNDIYIMYYHTSLKPDIIKYFYLKQLIVHDLVDLIFYYLAEAIRLDINHYPIVYPIAKLQDDYLVNYDYKND